MSFKFLNEGQTGNIQEVTVIDTFIDPVSKIRVSNPSNLIDTDFEYGLQPTKWETVELINNIPAFFSKSGDTTISDIISITSAAGTREITVQTAFPHNLDPGIPIRVAGTKSVTADGSYIINATPSDTVFTYLCRSEQENSVSIFDLYSSIITGEFFQGSQITINDADGIVTDTLGPESNLTIKTPTPHGFGLNTPFYLLNLNSTVSQQFQSQNTTQVPFDPTNSATARTFDGSNTLLQTPVDLSNSATTVEKPDNLQTGGANPTAKTFTVSIDPDNIGLWQNIKYGDPLYYSLNSTAGYFQNNPRGIVFIQETNGINLANFTATFSVSLVPNGPIAQDVVSTMTGYFKIANQARTFAGNNVNLLTEISLNIDVSEDFLADGGNQSFLGEASQGQPNVLEITGLGAGSSISARILEGEFDGYVGAMVRYGTTGTAYGGLTNNATYFIKTFEERPQDGPGRYSLTISELPLSTSQEISLNPSPATGEHTFTKIGVSPDKNIFHIKNSNFEKGNMLEYVPPQDGAINTSSDKTFFFVDTVFDAHNYRLVDDIFIPIQATGGNLITEVFDGDRLYRVHTFNSVGSSNFVVSNPGSEKEVEYLIVAGGGAGASTNANGATGGGGAGGVLTSLGGSPLSVEAESYSVIVGGGGSSATLNVRGGSGGNSSFAGIVAVGGSGGGAASAERNSLLGGSSGGAGKSGGTGAAAGAATAGQGNQGSNSNSGLGTNISGGGGGAGSASVNSTAGGAGRNVSITGSNVVYGGGGGGRSGSGGSGGGGAGASDANATNGTNGLGGGGGGTFRSSGTRLGGNGGSGVVIVRYPITPSFSEGSFLFATGGNKQLLVENGIRYALHTFTSGTSNFVVQSLGETTEISNRGEVEYLIVGGGGGGGSVGTNGSSGGGGAGGLITGQISLTTTGNYSVTVGAGGASGASNARGGNGGNSSFNNLTAIGGSGGGGRDQRDTLTGGSSGGAGKAGGTGAAAGAATAGQGNQGSSSTGTAANVAGGGGGAGSGSVNSTAGGSGRSVSITGSPVIYAGGGGGSQGGPGGSGGGGTGGSGNANGNPGVNGLGGGGGGTGTRTSGTRLGGTGGSGIVIIKYPIGSA
jgi:hypothetical protein